MRTVLAFIVFSYLITVTTALALPFPGPEHDTKNATLRALTKRGCKLNMSKAVWECDEVMPKMAELVQHLQSETGALATSSRSAVFYTNLGDPALKPNTDPSTSWVVGWLEANGFKDKYYWWGRCTNHYCELSFPPVNLCQLRPNQLY